MPYFCHLIPLNNFFLLFYQAFHQLSAAHDILLEKNGEYAVVIVKAGKLICASCGDPCTHAKLVEEGIKEEQEWAVEIVNRLEACTTVGGWCRMIQMYHCIIGGQIVG